MRINSLDQNPQGFKGNEIEIIQKGKKFFAIRDGQILRQVLDKKGHMYSTGAYNGLIMTTAKANYATPADYFPALTKLIKNLAAKFHGITKHQESSATPSLAKVA